MSDLPLYAFMVLLASVPLVLALWVGAWGLRVARRILERPERPEWEVVDLTRRHVRRTPPPTPRAARGEEGDAPGQYVE